MITYQGLKDGRMRVMSGEDYAKSGVVQARERDHIRRMDFVLTGCVGIGNLQAPYPDFEGYGNDGTPQENGVPTALRRDQAEHLVLELLKALNGGAMPDDSAKLVDFISSLGR